MVSMRNPQGKTGTYANLKTGEPTSIRADLYRSWRRDRQLQMGIVLIALSILVPALTGSGYWLHVFLLLNLYIAVCVFQNLLTGDAGQISFGQGAVFGLSAYTVGIASGLNGLPISVGILAGIAAGVALGCLFAFPALRVRGFYLGFVTISAAVVMPEMLIAFSNVTNGINGISLRLPDFHDPVLFGITPIALATMVLGIGSLVAHKFIRETSIGRRMRVAATSPEAALSLAYRPGNMRFAAFAMAAVGTSLAGVLYAPLIGFLSPEAFHFELSIFFFFAVIVGGTGHLLGPLVGASILYLVPNVFLVDLVNYRLLAYGLVALGIMLAFPDGVVGTVVKLWRHLRPNQNVADVSIVALLEAGRRRAERQPSQTSNHSGPAIAVHEARKSFGQVVALDCANVMVQPGTIHGLVGPNGSGKTTLLNMMSGLARLDTGTITIFGQDVTRMPAHRIAGLGVGRTFQTPRIFEDLSIWTNFQIGADVGGRGSEAWSTKALADVRAQWEDASPEMLPHAQRRLLEIMRVVAMEPRLLLLDEAAAGLSSAERRQLADLLKHMRDQFGYTVVLVEHDLHLVWRVADRITVLDAGRVVDDGPPEQIKGNPAVQSLFTGEPNA